MSEFHKEFGDFPMSDMPPLPKGFTDSSWHNDVCPSYQSERTHVFINYKNVELRECDQGFQFAVYPLDEEGCLGTDPALLLTDDWSKVEAFVKEREDAQ